MVLGQVETPPHEDIKLQMTAGSGSVHPWPAYHRKGHSFSDLLKRSNEALFLYAV
jgi:hypothetical protein